MRPSPLILTYGDYKEQRTSDQVREKAKKVREVLENIRLLRTDIFSLLYEAEELEAFAVEYNQDFKNNELTIFTQKILPLLRSMTSMFESDMKE